MNRTILTLFLTSLSQCQASVIFWQTSPGTFAIIQRGEGSAQGFLREPTGPQSVPSSQIIDSTLKPFVSFAGGPGHPLQFSDKVLVAGAGDGEGDGGGDGGGGNGEVKNVELKTLPEEKLEQDGLKPAPDVLKQLLVNRLNELEGNRQISQVKKLLDNSVDGTSFMDKTVGRSGSFLDRLISTMKADKSSIRESKSVGDFQQALDIDYDMEEGLLFFQESGLGVFSDQEHNDIEESKSESNILGSVLEEEEKAVEKETGKIAEQLSSLLKELELKGDFEQKMINKADKIIKSKLRSVPLRKIIKDKDFIESVFFRFAMKQLPLRAEDIEVAETFQVNQLLHSSMSFLLNLDQTSTDGRRRSKEIDKTKRELQKLLRITA